MRRFGRPVQPMRNAGPASFRQRAAQSGVTLPQINHASMLNPNERQQNNPMAGLATPQNMKTLGVLGDLFKSSPVDNDAARGMANASPSGPGAGYAFGGGDPMADSIQNNSALVAPKGVAPQWNVGGAFGSGGPFGGLFGGGGASAASGAGTAAGTSAGTAAGAKGAASAGAGGAASALPFIGAAYMGLNALGVRNQQGENPMFSGAGIMGYGPQGNIVNTVLDPDNLLGGIFGLGGGDGLGGILGL